MKYTPIHPIVPAWVPLTTSSWSLLNVRRVGCSFGRHIPGVGGDSFLCFAQGSSLQVVLTLGWSRRTIWDQTRSLIVPRCWLLSNSMPLNGPTSHTHSIAGDYELRAIGIIAISENMRELITSSLPVSHVNTNTQNLVFLEQSIWNLYKRTGTRLTAKPRNTTKVFAYGASES